MLIRIAKAIFCFVLLTTSAHAQDTQQPISPSDFDQVLQSGDVVAIQNAFIGLEFNVPALRMADVYWPSRPTGYRPDAPFPTAYIPLDALGVYILKNDLNNDDLFKPFYLYALDVWSLEKTTKWFETASEKFAIPAGSTARHPLADYQIDIIYQHIWDENVDEASRLRALWLNNIGPHEPLDRAISQATKGRVYPESERFGAEVYADYVLADDIGGACKYMNDYLRDTEYYKDSTSHAFLVRRRIPMVALVVEADKSDILASCDVSLETPQDNFDIALSIADLIGPDDALAERLLQNAQFLDTRCMQFAARADIGMVALQHQRTDLVHEMLATLDLGALHENGESSFSSDDCEGVSRLNFGSYDPNSEKDERLSLPTIIPDLFISCFGDALCNENNYLVKNFEPIALEAGIASVDAFRLLPDPGLDPTSVSHIVENAKSLFAQTDSSAQAQRIRLWKWALGWRDYDASSEALDALAPWFENMPVPQSGDGNTDRFLSYVYISNSAPVFRETLRVNLQTWLNEGVPAEGSDLAYIISNVGHTLLGEQE